MFIITVLALTSEGMSVCTGSDGGRPQQIKICGMEGGPRHNNTLSSRRIWVMRCRRGRVESRQSHTVRCVDSTLEFENGGMQFTKRPA